ncbi:MAG: YaiO family outer membrane beta-barrel protein [Candidatus Marinimicrobia bacterium]|jgi:YaiO family outer membrane protein|nr:YaiO family outer membrane beta-barrel protein [Candidatus Neomarinimicrobiota bacterium]MBT3680051.1 YaiO family outer membrane beta-barrel protein [Candidatus Neomarinimicrobiota bacterium]MBT3950036.1 YaiO family outer membrane beta-barrel protein [Candidatus Neomarinimicrobiota bacterium]MBT4295808.1 YaiO family outer membrane beta-barrel protein [Candidatus Neomarinimicrobiota bacterium]MBT4480325.1 YaiO family outer membrane beta-barrel protein [Candidatus Neomarinimicrobiota bacterium
MKNHILILQKHLINLALLLLVLLVVPSTRAGENLDSLFVEARHAAIELENRALAIELCRHALEVNPNYHDFRILMGRCYSWEGNYDKAEAELGQVVEAVESYQDARNALLDVYTWSKQDDKALDLLESSVQMYPNDVGYKLKQLMILESQGKISDATAVADEILLIDPVNKTVLEYKNRITVSEITRSTTLRYTYNRLAETNTEWQFLVVEPSLDPWHWISLEHKESFSFGPIIIKLNYANRFKNSATQIEVESYPVLRKGTYLYTGIGLSKSDLFPSFRMGLEIFQALPNDFEASLGFRYLEVPDNQIPIYVGSLGKYWQSYWISVKTYVSPSNSSLSKSWVLGVRKYLANPSNHIELYAGSGVSPDANLGGEEIDFLGSRSFGVNFKIEIKSQYDLNLGMSLSNLETRTDAFRGDSGIQVSFTKNY